jgi:hypothetical protein
LDGRVEAEVWREIEVCGVGCEIVVDLGGIGI